MINDTLWYSREEKNLPLPSLKYFYRKITKATETAINPKVHNYCSSRKQVGRLQDKTPKHLNISQCLTPSY